MFCIRSWQQNVKYDVCIVYFDWNKVKKILMLCTLCDQYRPLLNRSNTIILGFKTTVEVHEIHSMNKNNCTQFIFHT